MHSVKPILVLQLLILLQDEDLQQGSSSSGHQDSRTGEPDAEFSTDGEHMDIHQSEAASQSSETDHRPSDLERIESSASSLSLSSERQVDEGLLGIISLSRTWPHPIGLRPIILDNVESRRETPESASSWSLSALDEATSRVHLPSLDFGSTSRSIADGGTGSRTRLQLSLTQESMDQESSQLSQDSSNGSSSQPDELTEEDPPLSLSLDSSLRYGGSPGVSTPVDRPTVAATTSSDGGGGGGGNSAAVTSPATPLAVAGRVSGESVIVGGRTESNGGSGGGGDGETSDSRGGDASQQTAFQGECTEIVLVECTLCILEVEYVLHNEGKPQL